MTSKLYLEIDAELFAMIPLASGWKMLRLQGKRQGAEYTISFADLQGEVWPKCNCPDSVYRRHDCKHVVALREQGLLR